MCGLSLCSERENRTKKPTYRHCGSPTECTRCSSPGCSSEGYNNGVDKQVKIEILENSERHVQSYVGQLSDELCPSLKPVTCRLVTGGEASGHLEGEREGEMCLSGSEEGE